MQSLLPALAFAALLIAHFTAVVAAACERIPGARAASARAPRRITALDRVRLS